MKQLTFNNKHASGFTQQRSDYFYISNILQVKTLVDFIAALSTDHNPLTTALLKNNSCINGHGSWKFFCFENVADLHGFE